MSVDYKQTPSTQARNGLCVAGFVLTLVAFSPRLMSASSVDQCQQGVRGLSMMSVPDDLSAVGNLRQHLAGAIPDARLSQPTFLTRSIPFLAFE